MEGVRERIVALGRVRYLIAASNGHNQWLCAWQEAYPEATVFVAEWIPKKLPQLKEYKLLEEEPNPPWSADLDQGVMGVKLFGEVVLLHRDSKSLIVTDFVQISYPRPVSNRRGGRGLPRSPAGRIRRAIA